MAKMWIGAATKNAHGQFRAKAKKAGMSTAMFARHVLAHSEDHDTETVRQANLAKTLMKMAKHRKGMMAA